MTATALAGRASGLELARLIRRRELSPVELVDAAIARIEAVNPAINAVVATRFDRARDEARRAERDVLAGADLPPLHGVPFTVKECMALTGAPHTAGSIYRRGIVAAADAPAVAALRGAGAIALGSTNTSEMAMWWESHNLVYGRTANPYDPTRIPGGSSGGEGAIIGAGASPFGVGADVGGSIRMPAFFCGVFGHKPTGGLVSVDGHAPEPRGAIRRYCTVGPLARRAEDLWPLLRLMAGPAAAGDPAAVDFRQKTVLVCEGLGLPSAKATPEQLDALRRAAGVLEACGGRVETIAPAELGNAFLLWGAMMHEADHTPFAEIMTEGGSPNLAAEVLRAALGRGRHTTPALLLAGIERLFGFLSSRTGGALAARGRILLDTVEARLGDGGVLLMPTHPRPAPRHRAPLLRPMDFAYTGLWNVLELPATAVPMGLGSEGLPLGIQVVARRGLDHVTIAAAQRLEERFGGWVPPPRLQEESR